MSRIALGRLFVVLVWIAVPVAVLLAIELGLAISWDNPYSLRNEHGSYTRFHPAGILAYLKVSGTLYSGEHRIRFRVGDNLAIVDGTGATKRQVLSLGGSTTECALIPEGRRWPDLLHPPALNYGVSGNTSVDGYYNLRFLLEQITDPPSLILFMFAVNDLRFLISHGSEGFEIGSWNPPPLDNVLAILDDTTVDILPGIQFRDSALMSFLRYHTRNLVGRDLFPGYVEQRHAQDAMETVTNEDFARFVDHLRNDFLPRRAEVYARTAQLANARGSKLLLLSQPHAYNSNYRPYRDDLRLYPVLDNRKMTNAQARQVMGILNDHTRRTANVLSLDFVDVAACFSQQPLGRLFYDSVHYTLEGSKLFADCVDAARGDLDLSLAAAGQGYGVSGSAADGSAPLLDRRPIAARQGSTKH